MITGATCVWITLTLASQRRQRYGVVVVDSATALALHSGRYLLLTLAGTDSVVLA